MKKIEIKKNSQISDVNGLYIPIILTLIQIVMGLILIAPALVGSVFFLLNVFGYTGIYEASLNNLSHKWTGDNMSAAPVFMGFMAFAGAYLLNTVSKNILHVFYPAILSECLSDSLDSMEIEIEDSTEKEN